MAGPKTIFLAITHGWHARLLLQSSFLDHLLALGDYRVVLLAPNAGEPDFVRLYGDRCLLRTIEPQWPRVMSRTNRLRRNLLLGSKPTQSLQVRIRAMRRAYRLDYTAIKALNALRRVPGAAWAMRALCRQLMPDRAFKPLFDEFRPDLLVFCSLMHNEGFFIMRRAWQEKVPTLFVVESWDNPTTKVTFFEHPDHYLVWNQINRQEMIHYHGIDPAAVEVTGAAYHDIYAHTDSFCSRAALAARYGMDPEARWIVVAATTKLLYPNFGQFIDRLDQKRAQGEFGPRCQILIRPHPQTIAGYSDGQKVEDLEEIRRKHPQVFFDVPRLLSQKLPVYADPSDIQNLAEILFHADVLISFFSTVTLDAAAVDTPVVLPAFDDYRQQTWFPTMRQRLAFDHHSHVVAGGGVRVALDFEQMVAHVKAYLLDPSLDRDNRRRLVAEQLFRVDGNSGRRMAQSVVRFLESRLPNGRRARR